MHKATLIALLGLSLAACGTERDFVDSQGMGGSGLGGDTGGDTNPDKGSNSGGTSTGGQSNGGSEMGGAPSSETGGSKNDPEVPMMPPQVTVSPAPGATGVEENATIKFTFERPMNKPATQAAYQSADLGAAGVQFLWNAEGTELEIVPNEPLEYATGNTAKEYAFRLTTAAEDENGIAIEELTSSFFTLRRLEKTLLIKKTDGAHDNSLSSTWSSVGDPADFNILCSRERGRTCAGDTSSNVVYKAFLSFDISTLPDELAMIESAIFETVDESVLGEPYEELGALIIDAMTFSQINNTTYNASPEATLGVLATETHVWGGTPGTRDVTSAVRADFEARGENNALSQFRIQYEIGASDDGEGDSTHLLHSHQRIQVTYLIP